MKCELHGRAPSVGQDFYPRLRQRGFGLPRDAGHSHIDVGAFHREIITGCFFGCKRNYYIELVSSPT